MPKKEKWQKWIEEKKKGKERRISEGCFLKKTK
jgi:hypothetical protein